MMFGSFTAMLSSFEDYERRYPAQSLLTKHYKTFAKTSAKVFQRSHWPGHFTASSWLVSADGQRVLLTYHRKLQRWLQLGGHADGDSNLAAVALREAEEESGLQQLVVEDGIFDLDCHLIPAHGAEPEHWHYDVRYVVRAFGDEHYVLSEESLALAWRPIHLLLADKDINESIQRMASKWISRSSSS